MRGVEDIEEVLPLGALGAIVHGYRKDIDKGYELSP